MLIQENEHILFLGDSITDCSRTVQINNLENLGHGYVNIIAALLKADLPDYHLRITNRGVSGNRLCDLEERLETDVIAAEPTLISILIGINDTWHSLTKGLPSPIAKFEDTYAAILTRLRDAFDPAIILCEPFLLPCRDDFPAMKPDLDQRITIIRRLAAEFQCELLPLDSLFAKACTLESPSYWAPDGIHPSLAGHGLIARHWLDLAYQ